MFGVVTMPAPPAPHTVPEPPRHESRSDPRLNVLHRFFDRSDCPARDYSSIFLEVADQFELDWRLLPSISFVETTGGKSSRFNNLFGWDSGRARFTDPEVAIRSVGSRLANSTLYKSKKLDVVLATYNPTDGYARKVKSVMQRIASVQ